MTRFAWLQMRTQTLVVAAIVAALAIAAAITGVQLSHLYETMVAHCQSGCDLAANEFTSHDDFLQRALDVLALAAPALIGIFWGAPLLARELETGSYRLAWTQSVSRSRWLVTKLALVGAATVALTGALSLAITWWYRAIDHVSANQYSLFDRRSIVPIGYAAFAFATGAFVGAVVRRTVPAMATTLGVYVFARIATALWIRPHLMTPVRTTLSLLGAGPSGPVHLGIGRNNGGPLRLFADGEGPANSWTLSSHLLDSSGHQLSSGQISAFVTQHCPNVGLPPVNPTPGISKGLGPEAGRACLDQAAQAFHLLVTYQPASRYWAFQFMETGIFLGLALAASIGCYFWVTRRTN
jgi:ABC-type transport system involved in multi-copper enzyme maturation permease subunit